LESERVISFISDPPALFDELCVRLGLCLSPHDRSVLSIRKFRDLDDLELAVLRAEHLDPLKVDQRLRDDLRGCLMRYLY
jgi:hypothetical protein